MRKILCEKQNYSLVLYSTVPLCNLGGTLCDKFQQNFNRTQVLTYVRTIRNYEILKNKMIDSGSGSHFLMTKTITATYVLVFRKVSYRY